MSSRHWMIRVPTNNLLVARPLPFVLASFFHTSNSYAMTSKLHHLKVEIFYQVPRPQNVYTLSTNCALTLGKHPLQIVWIQPIHRLLSDIDLGPINIGWMTHPSDVEWHRLNDTSSSDIKIFKNYTGLHFFGKGDINVVSQDSPFCMCRLMPLWVGVASWAPHDKFWAIPTCCSTIHLKSNML